MTKILKAFVLLSVAVIVFDYVLGKCPNILYKNMIFFKKNMSFSLGQLSASSRAATLPSGCSARTWRTTTR